MADEVGFIGECNKYPVDVLPCRLGVLFLRAGVVVKVLPTDFGCVTN